MSDPWRLAREHNWEPSQAPEFDRRTQEGWRDRWKRLTGTMPANITDDHSPPDRIGHLLDLVVVAEKTEP